MSAELRRTVADNVRIIKEDKGDAIVKALMTTLNFK